MVKKSTEQINREMRIRVIKEGLSFSEYVKERNKMILMNEAEDILEEDS